MPTPPVILAYHGIADVAPAHDSGRLFVGPEKLRKHIGKLKRRGYEFLAMADFARRLAGDEDLSAKCALTFDDGTRDHLTQLLPILCAEEVPGTVYVCPELFGEPYPWCDEAAGVRLMTREEVLQLAASPWAEIGSHTLRHTVLGDAGEEQAHREMASCKQVLEEMLGREVPSFCYPRCVYSPACPGAAKRAGYTSAVTCGPRGSWAPFELRRESFHTPDGPLTFALKSRGLYYGIRDTAPARAARAVTRPLRHRAERA